VRDDQDVAVAQIVGRRGGDQGRDVVAGANLREPGEGSDREARQLSGDLDLEGLGHYW
jgi:hypothetical protein